MNLSNWKSVWRLYRITKQERQTILPVHIFWQIKRKHLYQKHTIFPKCLLFCIAVMKINNKLNWFKMKNYGFLNSSKTISRAPWIKINCLNILLLIRDLTFWLLNLERSQFYRKLDFNYLRLETASLINLPVM